MSEAAPSLRETLERFHQLIVAPTGVSEGLAQHGLSPDDLARMIVGDDRLSAVDRLDIYANMYFFRIRDVLAGDYPKLSARIGDAQFHNLVTDYLLACPPRNHSLREAGDRMAEFLATHAFGLEDPALVDLARLERARVEVFDGPDAETLSFDALRALPPETFGSLELRLIPSRLRLLLCHPVDDVWQAIEDGQEPPTIAPGETPILVWRQELVVYHRALSPDEATALTLIEEGASFGLLCERLIDGRTEEDAARLAFELLARWVSDGLIETIKSA